jgi:hypothetical protein
MLRSYRAPLDCDAGTGPGIGREREERGGEEERETKREGGESGGEEERKNQGRGRGERRRGRGEPRRATIPTILTR